MKNNQNSLNGVGNKEDEGYKKKSCYYLRGGYVRDCILRDGHVRDNNNNHVKDYLRDNNHVKDISSRDNYMRDILYLKDNNSLRDNYFKSILYLQQDKKNNLKKFKYLNSVDEMQSAYLCALELTFKFLGAISKSDQPTTFSKIIMSKGYYHMLRTAFDSIYQKRRRRLFFVGNEKGRRKSLNLDFTKQEQVDENVGSYCDKVGTYKGSGNGKDVYLNKGFCNRVFKHDNSKGFHDNESSFNNKKFKSNFDIISFVINFSSFKNSELPLSREGILGNLREKFGDIPRKLDDDQIEFILFGGAHTFVNYKDSPLRDLLQLTYASLRGLTKEFLKLKILKTPERIEEINKKIMKQKDMNINFDNNFLSYVNRYKESVFDLYYFLNKSNLDKQEIEIFNKIIYWLTCLKKELPQEEVQMISNRVKIDLFFYSKQYTIIVEFIESII